MNANKYTKIEREKVRMHLETLSKRAEVKTQTGSDMQGTTHLLDKTFSPLKLVKSQTKREFAQKTQEKYSVSTIGAEGFL